jgi:hypothetical protein
MTLAALCLAAALGGDPLDDLIARSAAVTSFTARYTLTVKPKQEEAPKATSIRLDFAAPDRIRLEQSSGEQRMSMWCVGDVLALDVGGGKTPLHARIDWKAEYAALSGIEDALHALRPDAPKRALQPGGVVNMRWSFDDKAQKAIYTLEAAVADERRTPFGWLETLDQKEAPAREDGELLRFATDAGAFDATLAKDTGVLRELSGRSPNGEFRLALDSIELDRDVPQERFTVPAPAEGSRDVAPELLKGLRRSAESGLRRRIYSAIAFEPEGERWNAERRARIESVLRPFHERAVLGVVATWKERAAKIQTGVSGRLRKMRAAGNADSEVEAVREREIAQLEKQLAGLEADFDKRLLAPSDASTLPRTAELLELERQVVLDVFRRLVREPALAEFERATAAAAK